jgi:hypothetical protein
MVMEIISNTPDWKNLLGLYGEGAADVEIARALGITIARFYALCDESDAFKNFAEKGRTLSQAWWYEQGRSGLFREKFNGALWNFNMKNRYGWADKVDTNDTTDKDPVNLDQAKSQLATALKTLGKKNPELLSGANLEVRNANG